MEHPCHNCASPVEDGVSFCPQCNAPQIRVTVADPGDFGPAATPPPLAAPGAIDWPQAFPAAIFTGAGMAVLALLTAPLLPAAFLVWMIAGGAICVAVYRRRKPAAAIRSRTGARLGAVSGLFGFLTFAALQSLLLFAASGDELRQELRQKVLQVAAQNPDPRAQEMLQRFATPEGLAVLIALTMVLFLVIFVAFGAIGGALWASRHSRAGG